MRLSKKRGTGTVMGVIVVLALVSLTAFAGTAGAATIAVTTTAPGVNDDAQCSLQEAIYSANLDASTAPDPAHLSDPDAYVATGCAAGSGDDTVFLPPGGVFTMQGPAADVLNYTGATATPMVTSTIVIEGAGAKIVHGGGPLAYRAFAVGRADDGFGVGGDLTLHEVHIKGFEVHGGNGRGGGGGGLGAGGAIYVHNGTLAVGWSTFEQNGALGGNGSHGNINGGGGGGGGLGGNGGPDSDGGGGGGGGARGDGAAGTAETCNIFCIGGGEGGGGGGTYSDANGHGGGFRCGGDGAFGITSLVPILPLRDGKIGSCAGGGGGGGQEAFTASIVPPPTIYGGDGGSGNYGGGGGGGAYLVESGSGGPGGFGGGGGAGTTADGGNFLGIGPGGGDGGFAGGGGAAAGGYLPIVGGSPGAGGTFGGDASEDAGGGGGGLGGAIFGDLATITIRNSTFFNNYANRGHTGGTGANDGRDSGGAIFLVAGSLVVNNSTFNNNLTTGTGGLGGGAIAVYRPDGEAASLVLRNSILAGNGPHECYLRNGAAASGLGNLIVDNTTNAHGDATCPGVTETGDPQLGPLQLNFPGKTPTMAIPVTSPAAGAADPATSEPDDQRGIARPQAGGHDIGAFEAAQDSTAPSAAPTQSPAANPNGWNSSDVTVSWHWTDEIGGSGIDNANCTMTSTSSGEGPAVGLSATCNDLAGNTGSASYTVKVDKTPPSLSPTLSASPVVVGQIGVTASPNASDSPSGVASSSCGAVDTSTPGPKTLTCSATDNAGNSRSVDLDYVVEYRILGFFDPVPGSKWKVSSTVPVKIALGNADGVRVSDAVGQALAANCRVRFSASGAQNKSAECMKYDSEKNQFVYAWKLGRTGTGAATIRVTIAYPGTTSTTQKTLQITITK
jgi:hypothetical protein